MNRDEIKSFLDSADRVFELFTSLVESVRKVMNGELRVSISSPIEGITMRGGSLGLEPWRQFVEPTFNELRDALAATVDDIKTPPEACGGIADELMKLAKRVRKAHQLNSKGENPMPLFSGLPYDERADVRSEIKAIRENYGLDDPFAELLDDTIETTEAADIESMIPPLDKSSGDWVTESKAAELDDVKTLRVMRNQGQKFDMQKCGIDKVGRLWRTDSKGNFWYFKPSLRSSKKSHDN